MRAKTVVSLGLVSLTYAQTAHSETPPHCTMTSAQWNVPAGATVYNRGNKGAISDVITAAGEYRTHVMLAHANGWITHNTMREPDVAIGRLDVCSHPLKNEELRDGWPGLSQINRGGVYALHYGDPSNPVVYLKYQVGNSPAQAEALANRVYADHPYWTYTSKSDPTGAVIYRLVRNGSPVNYSLYQYRDVESAHHVPGSSSFNGMACSTSVAYLHNWAGAGVVTPFVYSHATARRVLFVLHDDIKTQCEAVLPTAAKVLCLAWDVCENAANQVTNCMATGGNCIATNPGGWQAVANDPAAEARTISPDRIGGWSGHGSRTSIWAPDYDHAVTWSSPGNRYGCWD